jgi:signal transduction histidine kinase
VLDVPAGMHTLEVQGVSKLLRRMVRNLLENARRHGGPQGDKDEVILSLGHEEGQLVLKVCDRGPGVPAQYRERIFEPFFRLPGASERAGGVGLGLALVKSIAERHGWRVRCEARAGGGSCFVLAPINTSLPD